MHKCLLRTGGAHSVIDEDIKRSGGRGGGSKTGGWRRDGGVGVERVGPP